MCLGHRTILYIFSVLFYLYIVPGIKLRFTGFCSKYLKLLSHPIGTIAHSFNLLKSSQKSYIKNNLEFILENTVIQAKS